MENLAVLLFIIGVVMTWKGFRGFIGEDPNAKGKMKLGGVMILIGLVMAAIIM